MTTIYLTRAARERAERDFNELERVAMREVAVGDGDYVNVYSRDRAVIDRVVTFFGADNVVEIAL